MAETPLVKKLVDFIETAEQAAITLKNLKDQAMDIKGILEPKEEEGDKGSEGETPEASTS